MVQGKDYRCHGVLALLVLAFLLIQLNSIDYGTTINNQAAVLSIADGAPEISNSEAETPARWHQRFMLYSTDADEMLSVMALSRIKPHALQFDPQYYQYGGAWIYPLGGWFAALKFLGVLPIADIETMQREPDRMDAVYISGRIFVLLAFAASAIVLYAALLHLTSAGVALLIVSIYLFCPASIIMSQTMKPHWYSLLWVNCAVYCLVRTCIDKHLTVTRQVLLALFLALAVGSATTFALFSVFVWLTLLLIARRKQTGYQSLILVPAVALLFFVFVNPFLFISYERALEEYQVISAWFAPEIGLEPLWKFVRNSGAPGFGIAFMTLVGGFSLWQVVAPIQPHFRWLALGIVGTILVAAFMQANLSDWHVNFRYAPYFLTGAALLITGLPSSIRKPALGLVLVLTVFQSIPLIVAYADENDPEHSTRLIAATWVRGNVPPGEALCVNTPTPAPFNTPPFNLSDYRVNDPACKLRVHVEHIANLQIAPIGWVRRLRFLPRLSNPAYPLVIGHINPQVSIYEPM